MRGGGILVIFMMTWCSALGQAVGTSKGQGAVEAEEIRLRDLMENPAYSWFPPAWEEYIPGDSLMSLLAPHAPEYQWLVFLGSWCSDSHRWIPPLFRIFHDLGIPESSLRILALDEAKQDGGMGMVDSFQVEWIPTIILIREGKERGRIVETVETSMEAALLDRILRDKEAEERKSQENKS